LVDTKCRLRCWVSGTQGKQDRGRALRRTSGEGLLESDQLIGKKRQMTCTWAFDLWLPSPPKNRGQSLATWAGRGNRETRRSSKVIPRPVRMGMWSRGEKPAEGSDRPMGNSEKKSRWWAAPGTRRCADEGERHLRKYEGIGKGARPGEGRSKRTGRRQASNEKSCLTPSVGKRGRK